MNAQLTNLTRSRKYSPKIVLEKVMSVVEEMNTRNLRYDLNTYNALLTAYAKVKDQKAISETLDRMEKEGIKPTIDTYNYIMKAFGNNKDTSAQLRLKDEIQNKGIELNGVTYIHLLEAQQGNLQLALETFEEMKQKGITPTVLSYSFLIGACRTSSSDVAFKLLKEAEDNGLPVDSQPRMYFNVLRLGTREDEIDIVTYCWNKAVGKYSLRPDEGTCLQVLRVAAKRGDSKLAKDVIRQLSTSGYPYKQHYFTPLMEAFLVKDDLVSAFNVLDIMRVSGVPPTIKSIQSLREKLSSNSKALDDAYDILKELRKKKKRVDVVDFNVLLLASVDNGDVERTFGIYREAAKFGVIPDVDTYNAVLEVCVKGRVNKMDRAVIEEMRKANVSPNVDTFVKMIELSCNRTNYEKAFNYLEEMKERGFLPPQTCYEVLAKRLSYNRDPRFHLLMEEMEGIGYKLRPDIRLSWNK
ncbi:hypothetical protein G6F57_010025 [Rhizopus arrhizus]|uniref:Pentatricopeptide repeat-containing protein-mitochondrial domain-containing protein n=1 Tax=Rhizopus oryzae TaxID=64495 RepID=A0A9P7BSY2_RHIOR|nr:hypothetical protein G6F23_011273 [Rhizopus arrhizus]KAG1398061.1 hypothetical protein G6F58_011402 [Rhizopus delemar]KAG0756874.1 hypothetical protein G6F24_010859 [Rhizopus arrhizus]KAG0778653.1 hypothetical protein G6F22_011110 [Rhizopus arrhizus]KAG0784477.1 hypothetical protein G6F21_009884 [Rhizopus arrhizus]